MGPRGLAINLQLGHWDKNAADKLTLNSTIYPTFAILKNFCHILLV